MSFKNLEGQTASWIQRLHEYNFTYEHRQGQKHNNADALLRRPCQEECTHFHKVVARADVKQVRAIMAVAASGWDSAALRSELNDQDIGLVLQEVETGQCPEWKDMADRSPTYKSYWAQWKSVAVSDILERHWESADGRSKTAQTILPRSRVNDVLSELYGTPSRGHLGSTRPWIKSGTGTALKWGQCGV
jgi:hypothetical protein